MMFESPALTNYFYYLIEYIGYSNMVIVGISLYFIYYLLSNTFMFVLFLFIGIIIGIYIGNGSNGSNGYMKLM